MQKVKSVFGTSKQGFSFLELLVVIMIIAIMATIAVPMVQQRLPRYKRQQFVNQLNALVAFAWQRAVETQKMQGVLFDLEKRSVTIGTQTGMKEAGSDVPVLAAGSATNRKTSYTWPEALELRQFFIDGINEISGGKKVMKIWFYIVPDGMTQEVIINAVDTSAQTADGTDVALGLVLNPFTAQFDVYDRFAKP